MQKRVGVSQPPTLRQFCVDDKPSTNLLPYIKTPPYCVPNASLFFHLPLPCQLLLTTPPVISLPKCCFPAKSASITCLFISSYSAGFWETMTHNPFVLGSSPSGPMRKALFLIQEQSFFFLYLACSPFLLLCASQMRPFSFTYPHSRVLLSIVTVEVRSLINSPCSEK